MKLWEAVIEVQQPANSGSMTPAFTPLITKLTVPDAGSYWATMATLEAYLDGRGKVNALYEKF